MKLSSHLKERLNKKYGPWALVTGASSGIGRELAKNLASAELNLVICGRRESILDMLVEEWSSEYGVEILSISINLSNLSEVEKLVYEIDEIPIGLFVAAAGMGTSGAFFNTPREREIEMLQVNNLAVLLLTHHFARKFAGQKRGGIILLSSIVAFQGVPNSAHYAATKAYVQSLAEGLYHELKPYGVDVLAAAPGPVDTGFAKVADMKMDNALKPSDIGVPILRALGRKSTSFPGRLTKILLFGLRTLPRWGKIRIMKSVMGSMTEHQDQKESG